MVKKKPQARRRDATGGRIALYPGSFDPVTLGHLDVVRRASELFDLLHVAVIENPGKTSLLPASTRVRLLEEELEGLRGVKVITFDGLAVDAARAVGARWILRGLRSAADALYEIPMACSNRLCGAQEIETVFLPASPAVSFISSTLVREIAARGGRLEQFVTPGVARALAARFKNP